MEIPINELKYNRGYKIYNKGYRIVYFYNGHHKTLKNVCVDKIEDFILQLGLDNYNLTIDDILKEYLEREKDAIEVAIYDVSGKEIKRLVRYKDNNSLYDTVKFKEELIYDYDVDCFIDGYRVVYFYDDNNYSIGSFSTEIENFINDFYSDENSYSNEFVSLDDLLKNYLNDLPEINSVAIYKTDGTLVRKKSR